MKRSYCLLLLSGLFVLLSGLSGVAAQGENPLYLAIIWHQHQPVYFKEPETDVYVRPWVRVHATKDYLDMAQTLAEYPDVHATFNITPSLIRQLDDLAAGAKDSYWVLSEVPADELDSEQKRFILERFFDANAKIIARFPRYQELFDSRDALGIEGALESWTAQDFLDLQILFNLAWTDPDFLAQEPLAALVDKADTFIEDDKTVLFAEHLRIIQQVIPYHAALQGSGQIEVTMTPFAHPILPLLADSNLARVAMPDATLPERVVYGQDAKAQVELGKELYIEHFATPPRGMWPAEGSVAQVVVQMIADAGIQWIATDEEVLARSLPGVEDFTRNSEDTVLQADALYRPYTVTGGRLGQVSIVFRDHVISDKVGFEYSGMPGEAAADDLMQRLDNIQAQLQAEGAEGPNLVTILLDGENAWEFYDNDGKAFLHSLYQQLSESENIVTVTPSEYLEMTGPPREIEELWPGSWIDHDFSTWIGEPEENLAWDYLLRTRNTLRDAANDLDEVTLAQAMDLMYIAEGSDWFWWYGADQNSGVDEDFDAQFRGYLRQIHEVIGAEVPDFVHIPIIQQAAVAPTRPLTEASSILIDGEAGAEEWGTAAYYSLDSETLSALYYSFGEEALYLRLDSMTDMLPLELYLHVPGDADSNAYTRAEEGGTEPLLGFGAQWLVEINGSAATLYAADGAGGWDDVATLEKLALAEGILELALPFEDIAPGIAGGDEIRLRAVQTVDETVAVLPAEGPVLAELPLEALRNVLLEVTDPTGDDHGPGTFVYPGDAIFQGGVFDATGFAVGVDDDTVTFQITMRTAPPNDWGAPNGMGVLTVDVYVDVDGPANGARLLLPGRNASLSQDQAWDVAIWAEGWTPGVYRPSDDGPVEIDTSLDIETNAGQKLVTLRVPRNVLPGDPADWRFAVVVASQEGFPSAGVWRIRNVAEQAEQWLIGGGDGSSNQTRILDLIHPDEGAQETALSDFTPTDTRVGDLGPADFGTVPVISPSS